MEARLNAHQAARNDAGTEGPSSSFRMTPTRILILFEVPEFFNRRRTLRVRPA